MDSARDIKEIITESEIGAWMEGNTIIITAPTGSGKTNWAINTLYDFALRNGRKILFFLNRINLKDQLHEKITAEGKDDVITLMTYQKLEKILLSGSDVDINGYDYLICDEAHYFTEDSKFNHLTDLSFDHIMAAEHPVKIFMSATGKTIKDILAENDPVWYEIENDFPTINDSIHFYGDGDIQHILRKVVERGEKALVFMSDLSACRDLYENFRDHAYFNCSKYADKRYTRLIDEKAIQKMLKQECFDRNILITTIALDNGVTLEDEKLKHIFVDVKADVEEVLQCIGRKRQCRIGNVTNKNDKADLYLRIYTSKQINGYKSQAEARLKEALFYWNQGPNEYFKKYIAPRNWEITGLVYTTGIELKVNTLMERKIRADIHMYKEILTCKDRPHAIAWCECMLKTLKRRKKVFVHNKLLLEYLEGVVGKPFLTTKDRGPLIEKLNVRRDGHLVRNIEDLNNYMLERHLPFELVKCSVTCKQPDGSQKRYRSAWELRRETRT